jgi:hypothetical protein
MVSVIISYCNNDFQFIQESLQQVTKFSDDVQISYCTHSLDGEIEDPEIISEMKKLAIKYEAKTIECKYDLDKNARYHHNLMRFIPTWNAENDYILYLDADEIIEGEIFADYLTTNEYLNHDVLCFECYWYFRDRKNRAKTKESAGVLVRKKLCTHNYIFSEAERGEFVNRKEINWVENFKVDGNPIMHHYSWVRTKEQMLKKINCWAHKGERNWQELVEEEFSRDFNGTDFVHNYKYENYDYGL